MQMFSVDKLKYEIIGTDVYQSSITIDNSPTVVLPKNLEYKLLIIRNVGSKTVYLGNSSVSYTNGFPIEQKEAIGISDYKGELYGVTQSGSSELRLVIFR